MLKSRTRRPPPGWVYQQPETGFEMRGDTFDAVVNAVMAHRLANSLPRTDKTSVENDVDDYICGSMRGKKALWEFCETRFPLPVAQQTVQPVLLVPMKSAPRKVNGAKRTPCPTCGLAR